MPKSVSGKTTQTEKAYVALKRAILQGEIEEGSFLAEADVMARYKVGRTPYREACNRLHHEGLLQVVPHHGYLLPEISFQTVCELFEIRLILEDAVAQLVSTRATEQDIRDLEMLVKEGFSSEKSGASISEFVETNTKFHLALARASKNKRLLGLVKQTLENTERLMYIEVRSSGARDTDFRSAHEPILSALKKRDSEGVRRAVWNDIVEGQGLTLSIGKRHAAPGFLLSSYSHTLPGIGSVQPNREFRKNSKSG
jgi:DNA-binding GntR family transcriptional regulator